MSFINNEFMHGNPICGTSMFTEYRLITFNFHFIRIVFYAVQERPVAFSNKLFYPIGGGFWSYKEQEYNPATLSSWEKIAARQIAALCSINRTQLYERSCDMSIAWHICSQINISQSHCSLWVKVWRKNRYLSNDSMDQLINILYIVIWTDIFFYAFQYNIMLHVYTTKYFGTFHH